MVWCVVKTRARNQRRHDTASVCARREVRDSHSEEREVRDTNNSRELGAKEARDRCKNYSDVRDMRVDRVSGKRPLNWLQLKSL